MATNVENQEKYNEALEQSQKIMIAQTRVMQTQSQLLIGMVASIKDMDMSKVQKQSQDLEKAIFGLEEAFKKTSKTSKNSFSDMVEDFEKATTLSDMFGTSLEKLQKGFPKLAIFAGGALNGFNQGLKLSMNLTGMLLDSTKHLVGALGHVASSVVTAPFKMLHELIQMSAVGGSNELAQALEDIRKEFGYLKKESGAAIISMSRSMRGELANTGLSVYRVFGNLAEKLKYFAEYAKNLGPVFDGIRNNIGEGGAEALGAYNKALGMTTEGLKAIATRAMITGRSLTETNREVANYALQLSDAFGVTMKEVSRDVGTMMSDFTHFGHLGAKELTQTAVYARKLGLEIKALGAVMDKWMNFEDAAQGAAQLSQAFGLNIDALNMMKAQDPSQKIDQLRKAFFRAGKSVETMTYQERRLLAQQTGLDDASIGLAFSLKSQGTSYDQIARKGNAAQKAQLTQAQALQKLSGAIERMVKSGEGIRDGFVDTFFKGFALGIRRSRDFRGILRNIQRDLRATLRAGRDVGRMFVDTFPGVKDFFQGLRGFFDPRKFREMLGKVKDSFRTFFNQIAGKDPEALPNLLKNLNEGFLSFFDSRSPNGQKFLNGAKQIFTAFVTIVNGLFKKGIEGVIKGIGFITEIVSGRRSLSGLANDLRSSGGFFGKLLDQLIAGVPQLSSRLGNAFLELWEQLKIRFGPRVERLMYSYLYTSLGLPLGAAFARGFLASAGGALVKGLGGMLKNVAQRGLSAATTAGRGAQRNMPEIPHVPRGTGAGAAGAIEEATTAAQAAERSNASTSSISKMIKIGLIITVGMIALMVAMKNMVMWVRENNVTISEITKAGILMGVTATTLVAAAGSVTMLMAGMKFSAGSAGGMLPVLGALGAVVVGMLATAGLMVGMVQRFNFTSEAVAKSVVLMGSASAMLLAASAVVGISGAIGAVVVATDGLAVGAILAGLATLAVVVGGMVQGTMGVMNLVNEFRASPDFVAKAGVFVNMFGALGHFASMFKDVAAAAAPGILGTISSVLFRNDPQKAMQDTLGKITEIVNAVGDQARGFLNAIIEHTKNVTPEQVERGRGLVEVLRGIGEFSQSLQPPLETMADNSAWFEGSNSVQKIQSFSAHMEMMGPLLMTAMTHTFNLLADLQSLHFNEESLNGVRAFSQILKTTGELIKNLMPNQSVLSAVSRSTGGGRAAFGNISNFMRDVLTSITSSDLFGTINGLIDRITNGISGLSPRQLTVLQRVAPILEGTIGSIGSISSLFGNLSGVFRSGAGLVNSGSDAIVSITSLVSTMFDRLENVLPNTINSIKRLQLTPREGQDIRNKMEVVKSVFDALKTIPTMVTAFHGNATEAGPAQVAQITSFVNDSNRILALLFDHRTPSSQLFQSLLVSISGFNIPQGLDAKVASIGRVFTALGNITHNSENLSTMAANAQRMAEQIKANTVSHVSESIQSIVNEVNDVSQKLNTMDVPNINVALQRVARDIGLGQNGTFAVHRGTFNFNVNVGVTLDSRDLQTTLVQTSRNTNSGERLATTGHN